MEGLKYKTIENVIWFLGELYSYDERDIEDNDFDVVCETKSGADSRFSVSIIDLAGDARGVINEQQQEIAELKSLAAYAEQRANILTKANESLKAALHLAVTKPMQPLIDHRFKENKIVSHCLYAGGTDLNKIAVIDFSVEDREQFAQLIGYSLSGYGDLSYVTDETYDRAEKQSEGKS